jgi:arginase
MIPIVLAGDCSVILGGLLGTMQAMRASGLPDLAALLFVDGHVDFYQPEASTTGEVADMDLALATGRGPAILTTFDGRTPLVRDDDVAAVGARDRDEREKAGSQDIRDSGIRLLELATIRDRGIDAVADEALEVTAAGDASRFWCHIDADVLDDAVMPAVDYRQPDGLTPDELTTLLRKAHKTGSMAGLSIAIYNPALDPDGDGARLLVDIVANALRNSG